VQPPLAHLRDVVIQLADLLHLALYVRCGIPTAPPGGALSLHLVHLALPALCTRLLLLLLLLLLHVCLQPLHILLQLRDLSPFLFGLRGGKQQGCETRLHAAGGLVGRRWWCKSG
jgi:hypothetical protein